MRFAAGMLLTAACVPSALWAQTALEVSQLAQGRIKLAEALAADPQLRKAVAAKNAERETQAAIEAREREWSQNKAAPLRKALTSSPCAERLRELVAHDPLVVEAILMDARGANVCVSRETSDYWQGDEDKWRKPFVEGRPAFVDEPAFDQSTGTYAVQLSVPVADAGARIGALTLTLKVRKGAATSR
jgi:hypothetical protein